MQLPGPLHAANEGLAFLIELIAFAALAWWGFTAGDTVGDTAGDNVAVHIVLGIGAPAVAIGLWGSFAAPKARYKVALPLVLLVKAAVFGAAALALYGVGRPALAAAFAIVALVNTALATLDRDARFRAQAG